MYRLHYKLLPESCTCILTSQIITTNSFILPAGPGENNIMPVSEIDDGTYSSSTIQCQKIITIVQGTVELYQMWQSWVEIEHYSFAYFDPITAFEAL